MLGNKLPYSRLSVCDIGHAGGSSTRRYLFIIIAGCDSFMILSTLPGRLVVFHGIATSVFSNFALQSAIGLDF